MTGHHGHDHGHSSGADHDHHHTGPGGHRHPAGIRGFFRNMIIPHSHDAADSIDDAFEANAQGIRVVKISLIILLATTAVQGGVVAFSGSVALLADTIHNFSDALTAVPLWIAFVLGRRLATRRYTFGLGRAEDLAGLFIVLVVALSAVLAAWQSIGRIVNPQPPGNLGWVIAAGVVGFLGNEAVAVYRVRVGQRIGSAALIADGVHARADGYTSLAVVLGGIGVLLGFPLADPIVGLLISAAVIVLLWGTVRSVGHRLMDGIEPELIARAEHALGHVHQISRVDELRLRWVGHRLQGDALVTIPNLPLAEANMIAREAEESVRRHLRNIDAMHVRTITLDRASTSQAVDSAWSTTPAAPVARAQLAQQKIAPPTSTP